VLANSLYCAIGNCVVSVLPPYRHRLATPERHVDEMRVVLVTDAWEPQTNGVVSTLRYTMAEMQRLGIEVLRISPEQFTTVPCPSYPEIRLAVFPGPKVGALLNEFQPDAIHIATEGTLGVAARQWCIARKLRFTTSYHTQFPEYVRARWPIPLGVSYGYMRWFHDAAEQTMVSTREMQSMLERRGFRNLKRWGRGVDTELFRPSGNLTAQTVPLFAYLGRVSIEKNVDEFLALDLPGRKLVIGDGPARESLQQRFPEVRFTGVLKGQALVSELNRASVLVFPSQTDTFGLVMLEAMACGVPVAAFPVTGPIDVVTPGVTGELDQDLRRAAIKALQLDRAEIRRLALTRSWANATAEFVDNLVSARKSLVGRRSAVPTRPHLQKL
jgi:glycosyltransferase involved in cell wall biosynthesis